MIKFAFSNLTGDELYKLAKKTDEIISHAAMEETGLDLYYKSFKTALNNYNLYKDNFSDELKILHHKAILRADYCQSFFKHIENYYCYPDEDLKKQIKQLLNSISRFNPDIQQKCCRTETMVLQTVIGRIELEFKDLLIKIKADAWFDLLEAAQIDFEKLMKKLIKENVNNTEFDLHLNSLPLLIISLKRLLNFISLQYELTTDKYLSEILQKIKAEFEMF